jgi:hypothetical protein
MITRAPWVVLPLLLVLTPSCKRDDAAGSSATSADGGAAGASAAGAVPGSDTNGAALPGASGPTFEGSITMHMTDAKSAPHDITMITKGNKIRVDVPEKNGTSAHSIFDPSTGKALVIMDAQKMAMTMTIPAATVAGTQGAPPVVTKTGKHETIAGRDCEDWDIVQATKHEQACVTEGIVFFDFTSMSPTGAQRGSMGAWLSDLRDKHEFPLRAITLDPSGKESSRMEVTKLDAKPVDDSLFTVPAGYREMDMSKLSGLANALGGKGLPH